MSCFAGIRGFFCFNSFEFKNLKWIKVVTIFIETQSLPYFD